MYTASRMQNMVQLRKKKHAYFVTKIFFRTDGTSSSGALGVESPTVGAIWTVIGDGGPTEAKTTAAGWNLSIHDQSANAAGDTATPAIKALTQAPAGNSGQSAVEGVTHSATAGADSAGTAAAIASDDNAVASSTFVQAKALAAIVAASGGAEQAQAVAGTAAVGPSS